MQEGVPFARRDYFKDRFTVDELRELLAGLGLRPREVLSRRSRAYKELIGDREAGLTDGEVLDLMVAEPTLLRRPLVAAGGRSSASIARRSAR